MNNVLDLSAFSAKVPRLVLVHEDVDRASVKWWKDHASQLGYNLIFRIKHGSQKLDVLTYTVENAQEVALKGLTVYLNWQIQTAKC